MAHPKTLFLAPLIFLWMTSCAAPAESFPRPTQTLPPPIVRVTRFAPSPISSPAQTITPPAKISIPQSNIAKLADEMFGARQIRAIEIPSLNIKGAVIPVGWKIQFDASYQSGAFEWDSPDANIGWVITSALPDEAGNIILYGHNNLYEKVFENLWQVKRGEMIYAQTESAEWAYRVEHVLILPVVGADAKQVAGYKKYLQPTSAARVTIISCWPPQSNTHRVVVIGIPAGQ